VPDELGNGELWAAVVAPAGFDEGALRTHCGRHLPAMSIPARFVTVDQIPRNTFGKIDRGRLSELAGEVRRT